MADEQKAKQRLEIAHVLFMDIVGYSTLLTDEQSEALHELNQIVRNTEAAREADAAGQLTILPTGDGMALVFTGSVEEPVECALEISHALRAQPSLPVRMGIHSGPVHHVKDANGRDNIAGVGINIAQRVMDCGDAGHILVSKRVADDLAQQRRWQPYLHELGDVEVKHGVVVSLVNFYAETIGNPAPPGQIGKVRGSARALQKGPRKGLSPVTRAIFILVGLVIALAMVLSIVSVIFAPAIVRTLEQHRSATLPQPTATAPQSFADTIKSAITKQITDELKADFSGKKKAAVEPAPAGSAIPEKSIAVLPFENLSDDKSNAYLADGIQEEILTKLATIADLKVISRTSTAKYKSKPEDLKTVAQQLGVANILEGSVQRAGDKVRVNVQLIDARTDSHLWAKSYDGDAEDIFDVETEVSEHVADALQAKLSPKEAKTIATAPTQDAAAYDFYLKGEFEFRLASSSLRPEQYDEAAAWYEKAIERDPNFAAAIAQMAICRLTRHWFVENLTDPQLAEIKEMAEHAISLQPDLPDAHVALGLYYYFGYRKYEEALGEFARALQLQPKNTRALEYSGYVHRRLGQWQTCVSELKKALETDPRNAYIAGNLGQTYVLMREWNEAERTCRNALSFDPHDVIGMRALFLTTINSTGDATKALRIAENFPPGEKAVTVSISGTVASVTGERAYAFLLARDFDGALKVWDTPASDAVDTRRRLAARVAIRVLSGDLTAAGPEAEQGAKVLEARLQERPDELLTLRQLSWTYLALGRKDDALRLARKGLDLLPPERDALLGNANLAGLAEIEARTGATADAVQILRRLLSIPAGESVSIARLKIDPVWDPIRNDSGFRQLLTIKEHVGP